MALLFLLVLLRLGYCAFTSAEITADSEWSLATATHAGAPSFSSSSSSGWGACGYRPENRRRMTAAVSSEIFRRGSGCGNCFEIRCVDHTLYCLSGSPSAVISAVDFCAPDYGLPSDGGGWCNFPRHHFHLSLSAFASIAAPAADIVPVQYRRAKCGRRGGMRFTIRGWSYFCQVLITNVGFDGQVSMVRIKGSRATGWSPMVRNWGQNWHCNADLKGQSLSFEVTGSHGRRATSFAVAPTHWAFGQTFEGHQFQD